jgi:hypothetical protein
MATKQKTTKVFEGEAPESDEEVITGPLSSADMADDKLIGEVEEALEATEIVSESTASSMIPNAK